MGKLEFISNILSMVIKKIFYISAIEEISNYHSFLTLIFLLLTNVEKRITFDLKLLKK